MKSLVLLLLCSSIAAADDLQPIPLQETIPAESQTSASEPELLPPATPVEEEPTSFHIAPPTNSDIVIDETSIIESEVNAASPVENAIAEDPSRTTCFETHAQTHLPYVELQTPDLVFEAAETTVVVPPAPVVVLRRPLHLVVGPPPAPVRFHPHGAVLVRGHLQIVDPALGVDLVALEVQPAPALVPGQPVRNLIRARRAGLFR